MSLESEFVFDKNRLDLSNFPSKYRIGVHKDSRWLAYVFIRDKGDSFDVLLSKNMSIEDQAFFDNEVDNLSKIFNASIHKSNCF